MGKKKKILLFTLVLLMVFGLIILKKYQEKQMIKKINNNQTSYLDVRTLKKLNYRILEKTELNLKEKKVLKYLIEYEKEKAFYKKSDKLKEFYYQGANFSEEKKEKLDKTLLSLIEESKDEKEKILLLGTIKKINRFRKNERDLDERLMKSFEGKIDENYLEKVNDVNFNPFTFDIIDGEFILIRVPKIGDEN